MAVGGNILLDVLLLTEPDLGGLQISFMITAEQSFWYSHCLAEKTCLFMCMRRPGFDVEKGVPGREDKGVRM